MTHTITYEGCCEHGELLDKYCAKCDQDEQMTHTCKCKSESERMRAVCVQVSKVINHWYVASQIWCSTITSAPEYGLFIKSERIEFDSINDAENWANDLAHKIELGRRP